MRLRLLKETDLHPSSAFSILTPQREACSSREAVYMTLKTCWNVRRFKQRINGTYDYSVNGTTSASAAKCKRAEKSARARSEN